MTTWARLAIDVIALTLRPASMPTPMAIATNPGSVARRRTRSLASAPSALRGRKLIAAAERFQKLLEALACFMRGRRPEAKRGGQRSASAMSSR